MRYSRFLVYTLMAVSLLTVSFQALPVSADTSIGGTGDNTSVGGTAAGSGLQNPLKVNSLAELLNAILDFVITIGGIIVVVMIVFIGFKFVLAQGKSEELVKAREMLLWTVIGALILLGAKAIETGIVATVNSLSS